jgi:putative endonuclease
MAIQQERGKKGEQIAEKYLRKNGYDILEMNYRAGKSEIDLICKQANTLVFVEVKARTSSKFGQPEEFVGEAKATKIIEGAEAYILENSWDGAIRFDIVAVLMLTHKTEVNHFEDAFY